MIYFTVMTGMFSLFLMMIVGWVGYKKFVKREHVEVHYTPFDYITAQSSVEFHDEKEDHEEQDGHGDDKDPQSSGAMLTRASK